MGNSFIVESWLQLLSVYTTWMLTKMELLHKLLSALFPSRCILCGQTVITPAIDDMIELCTDCYRNLPFNESCCAQCALPLPEAAGDQVLCGRCINKLPAFDYCHSLFRYEDDIIHLVHQLKFGDKISYARSLGELLYHRLQAEIEKTGDRPDCLLPVPLHNRRLRQRGYNQSIEIARVMSHKLNIPIEYNLVERRRYTETQTGLNAKQRRKNISKAFLVSGEMRYRHVLVVDDVVTTGATVNELALLLKKHKVERVGIMSIARAPVKN
jgi:ComF family protein